MKRHILRLLSVWILVLPLLAACGSLENPMASKFSTAAQKAMVAAKAHSIGAQVAQSPNQGGKVAQETSSITTKPWWQAFTNLPQQTTSAQGQFSSTVGAWWENLTKKLNQAQSPVSGGKFPYVKQPQRY